MSSTSARFQIRNVTTSGAWSLAADAGFDCAPGDVLALRLQEAPALDIWRTQFIAPNGAAGYSASRTALTFPSSGVAATPTSEVQITMPSERGSWDVECQTNGGAGSEGGKSTIRMIAIRSANLSLRHPLAAETREYEPDGGWAVAIQELIDAVDAGSAAAILAAHFLEDAATAVAPNGIPLRNMTGTLAFKSSAVPATFSRTGVAVSDLEVGRDGRTVTDNSGNATTGSIAHRSMSLPATSGGGPDTEVAQAGWQYTGTVSGGTSKWYLKTLLLGTLGVKLTVAGDGTITLGGAAYLHNGYRPVFDGSGVMGASVITEAEVRTALALSAGTVAINGQTLTLCAGVDNAGGALPIGGSATALTFDSTTGVATWKKAGTSARVDTFDSAGACTSVYAAGVTTIIESWTQAASGAGGAWTRTGQKGASGSVGGDVGFATGAGGTPGTNLAGSFFVDLGAKVSQATAPFELRANTAVFGSMGCVANYWKFTGDVTNASSGIWIYSPAIMQIEGVGVASVKGSQVWLQPANGIVSLAFGGTLGATIGTDGASANFLITATNVTLNTSALTAIGIDVNAPRVIRPPAAPTSSSNALTIDLSKKDGQDHVITEATTVTISGGTWGQEGDIVFSQPASAKVVTMPPNGSGGVEYENTIAGLGVTNIVDQTNLTRTVLTYRVLANGRAAILSRAVILIP